MRSPLPTLSQAHLDWSIGDTPRSQRFGDIYFTAGQGLAESRWVFLDGIGVPSIWRDRHRFALGETGFGTGLNFLLTWQAWRESASPGARLDYVAVEGFPLGRDDLARALAAFPELAPLARQLVEHWPGARPGFHRIMLENGRVALTLLMGEAAEMLSRLEGRFDAWYLDGFAPSRNPEMWRPEVLAQVARLSAPGARLATFTAAGEVRRNLQALGFVMEKAPGFGRKRECLRGRMEAPAPVVLDAPWYAPAEPAPAGPVAVIGGGIAGVAAAHALAGYGFSPVIIERHAALAREASGNPAGLFKPHLTASASANARFHSAAFFYAKRLYETLPEDIWHGRGLALLARDAEDAERLRGLAGTEDLAEELEHGIEAPFGGLFFPHAGCIAPSRICEALSQGIATIRAEVASLERIPDGWALRDPAGEIITEAAAVVLANGPETPRLCPSAELPIHANRGQISFVEADGTGPSVALSFGGYATPEVPAPWDGRMHVIGATFGRWPDPADLGWSALSEEDHAHCLDLLRGPLPALAERWQSRIKGGRAALRATTDDHLPLVGPVPDAASYRQDFADLHHGRRPESYPAARWQDGLYVLSGLGSKGFPLAPLAAEILAATMAGAPLPVERDVAQAIHPSRFLVRALRRRPLGKSKRPE
ncbi:bifunctional tRNA (5-methylaminomethyl-2-thiouridine)(34)-methyltransferase MnmD/FAD-dependent 5-carboxymethylaminomethyl-2-thiouridine(34) oxidoreductase MnmC [Telmatospirillum sp. J64-1]|uniref:bifunctional tRNA (5-methylaminomethyl-2-thiouridine)(34)-methyltransferase MnmD/FAD-dependent 5-carboxymethylaminomethyl-2-thiouridine(34) oxidoreductase MnmC n=1 Tax=Telmatospirillum sp. J64-1 TaxID=2502183 RepID=UPI00163DE345|nr:bifunctional tRNA (5-methylaminomethyl-2-thiouridine)(34)-methyltransferase MnmD/FAD-dependent 5-carboxymethylaminomethyl-2-thiouridine(34) oxidoreductase MnmC [Telmatospirillum sp. J64-1]